LCVVVLTAALDDVFSPTVLSSHWSSYRRQVMFNLCPYMYVHLYTCVNTIY